METAAAAQRDEDIHKAHHCFCPVWRLVPWIFNQDCRLHWELQRNPVFIFGLAPAPPYGSISGTFFLGETVTFTCIAKYELVGSSSRTCQTTQQWTGAQPTCVEIVCPPPEVTPNCEVNGGRTYGDTVTYTCVVGYKLTDGTGTRVCLATGEWDVTAPQCE
ncbi:CSMD1, partial [Branchiostoma lanceolatum]